MGAPPSASVAHFEGAAVAAASSFPGRLMCLEFQEVEKFSVASMGRRKCALWTSGTGARSTCGLIDLRVGLVGGGGAIMEIPYLAPTEDFSEVRDI